VKFDINATVAENEQYVKSIIDSLSPFVSTVPGGALIVPLLKLMYEQSIKGRNKNRSITMNFKQKVKHMTMQQFGTFSDKKEKISSFELFCLDYIDRTFNDFFQSFKYESHILNRMDKMIDQKISAMDVSVKNTKAELYDHLKDKMRVYKFILNKDESQTKMENMDEIVFQQKSGLFDVLVNVHKCMDTIKNQKLQNVDEKVRTLTSENMQNKKYKMDDYSIVTMMTFDIMEDIVQFVKNQGKINQCKDVDSCMAMFKKIMTKTQKSGSVKKMKHYSDLFFYKLFDDSLNSQKPKHKVVDFLINSLCLLEKNSWTVELRNNLLTHSLQKFPFKMVDHISEKLNKES